VSGGGVEGVGEAFSAGRANDAEFRDPILTTAAQRGRSSHAADSTTKGLNSRMSLHVATPLRSLRGDTRTRRGSVATARRVAALPVIMTSRQGA
jgi:hypothetical protein